MIPKRFIVCFILCLISLTTTALSAQTFTLLHSFGDSGDGFGPRGPLVLDAAGNLYGTTYGGGTKQDAGVTFRLDPSGNETILHYFNAITGARPIGGLTPDSPIRAYGVTFYGGRLGAGTIYKLDRTHKYTVIHDFDDDENGSNPTRAAILDAQGNLYGTTLYNRGITSGVIFKVDSAGNYSVLYDFFDNGDVNGLGPDCSFIMDRLGNLYGTTIEGGSTGGGTVFRFDPKTLRYKVLHTFQNSVDGYAPRGTLVADPQGNLYGTTSDGGVGQGGTVYKLSPSGQFSVLHSFYRGGNEGYNPQAGLIRDSAGSLYGTNAYGDNNIWGTVFKIDSAGITTILHAFTGFNDGSVPIAEMVRDASGNLYGATSGGGTYHGGTAFKISQ